jgi:C4-dicarboxylate-specific signal transduction histidine kinase
VPCGAEEVISSLREVTERRRAEEQERQQQAELAHVARLRSMGALAAALAHEINQPLMAIVAYASGCMHRIEAEKSDPRELLGALQSLSEQAVRAGEIIRRLQNFVRKGPPQRQAVDVNELVRNVVAMAEVEARQRGIPLQTDLQDGLPWVLGDGIQIEQVIFNLVRNGVEAMAEGGHNGGAVRVRTRYGTERMVEISVCDHGRGLAPDLEARLFEPFLSTKPSGLGIGLSISRSIVEAHGGRLWATRNTDLGTTFCFTLPVAQVS